MAEEVGFYELLNWKGDSFTLQCYTLVNKDHLYMARNVFSDSKKENDLIFVLDEDEWPYGVVLRERDVKDRGEVLANIVDMVECSMMHSWAISLSFMFEAEFLSYNIFEAAHGHRGIYAFSLKRGNVVVSTDIDFIRSEGWEGLISIAKEKIEEIIIG